MNYYTWASGGVNKAANTTPGIFGAYASAMLNGLAFELSFNIQITIALASEPGNIIDHAPEYFWEGFV